MTPAEGSRRFSELVTVGEQSSPSRTATLADALGFERLPTHETESGTTLETGGVIYSDPVDMPSLDQLLARQYNFVADVLSEKEKPLSVFRVAVSAAIATVFATLGITLLVVDALGEAHPNPYIGLMLALGGLVLCATVAVALTDRRP